MEKNTTSEEPPGKGLGKHLLVELHGCSKRVLGNLELVKAKMMQAAIEAKATIVEVAFHEFSPFGISGMVVIAESHLSIHSWPEKGYAAVDVFTCGDLIDPWVAVNYLTEAFEAAECEVIVDTKRGLRYTDHKPVGEVTEELIHEIKGPPSQQAFALTA